MKKKIAHIHPEEGGPEWLLNMLPENEEEAATHAKAIRAEVKRQEKLRDAAREELNKLEDEAPGVSWRARAAWDERHFAATGRYTSADLHLSQLNAELLRIYREFPAVAPLGYRVPRVVEQVRKRVARVFSEPEPAGRILEASRARIMR